MSRGLGRTQRAILAAIEGTRSGRTYVELAGIVYGTDAPTQISSYKTTTL